LVVRGGFHEGLGRYSSYQGGLVGGLKSLWGACKAALHWAIQRVKEVNEFAKT